VQQTPPFNPLELIVWAGIEEVIKDARLAGLIQIGRAVANALPGATLEEKLAAFEGGPDNREVVEHKRGVGRLVRLRRDVFAAECCGLPWSRQVEALLVRYNNEVPRGGAASHPLHIVLHEVHRGLGNVVDIATRHPVSGTISFSRYGLLRAGLDEAEATRLLGDGAVLYCICEEA